MQRASQKKSESAGGNVRLATLNQLVADVLPNFIDPPPCKHTLRHWFDAAGIPRFQANPHASRGGGKVFYQVAAVERLLRSRLLPGKIKRQISRQIAKNFTEGAMSQ